VTDSRVDIAPRRGKADNSIKDSPHTPVLTYNTLHVALEILIRLNKKKGIYSKFKNIEQGHRENKRNDMLGILYSDASLVMIQLINGHHPRPLP
jgi:hypothetical protein